jgi:hypothetical protein
MKVLDIGNGQTIQLADVGKSYGTAKMAAYGETDTIVATGTIITPVQYGINGGYYIVPDGLDNKFGYQLMQLLEDSNLGLGVIRRQRGLQYGQGLGLYTVNYVEGRREVQWMWDEKIGKWLDSWDYEEYLINILLDLLIKQEYFTKLLRSREGRINGGTGPVAAMEHVPSVECRRQWPDDCQHIRGGLENQFSAKN